ncbi:hypothetical protein PAXRUDRAFT_12220 [Paxillus rubicundulus Ve08.2h10]|uniref:PEHE domain-containing protein n=1 Tax=Paxillus rubicundulus Ve08.2h10 TaxID=930991 RepID=A0A0D0DAI8_9AGAM|nr:hypothetical protein PAXRUDRAFT_12220 [Paxillus rubicundulus Ve08.2h10]
MAEASFLPTSHPRQKRVLPSRPRRGGPGIGSCDVDLMILDAQKRRLDNEPLIPADTPFLLTTNSALLNPSSSRPSSFGLNSLANQRYFDRPDVMKAYREQLNIQTPEFSFLSEDASVGGRFRPRSSGEVCTSVFFDGSVGPSPIAHLPRVQQDCADTSDATYEKRHRKYETFEKRQRLREKEKLKHEQYKLKERIEQLKAMDGSAFLGLPATSFLLPAGTDDDETLPGAHINGAAIYHEGERRRQEMLEVASMLEERYRTLLPSEKKLADLKGASRSSSVNLQLSDVRTQEDSIFSARETFSQPSPKPNAPSIVLKIKVPQFRQKDPNGLPLSIVSSPGAKTLSQHHLSPTKPFSKVSSDTLSTSSERSRKRSRASCVDYPESPRSTPEHVTKPSHSSVAPKTESLLMQWALRTRAAPNARKTQRHVTAFGTKVPLELEEVRDFELPRWIRPHSPTVVSEEPKDIDVSSLLAARFSAV